jgi:hypothetical protein
MTHVSKRRLVNWVIGWSEQDAIDVMTAQFRSQGYTWDPPDLTTLRPLTLDDFETAARP